MRHLLLSALIALSPLTAFAGTSSGEINISLTIMPTCAVSVTGNQPSVSCAQQSFSQPHISESRLPAVPGISVGTKRVTVEW
ncbi:hypothetical protein [Ewingella americana]|uniref:Fimbrial protein n=1 Tax=Ewingella americana TaxID=41202 RepID=A0A502GJ01_9GAMM|nr:hypothetical protein [Ewingella americana]TPG62159.1 hypothetical protein EAH77_12045 [Ewingella americana]